MSQCSALQVEPASYRDPSGYVFYLQDQVYRHVSPEEGPLIENLLQSGFFLEMMGKRMVIGTRIVRPEQNERLAEQVGLAQGKLLQHDRVEFLSYPYEWSVSMSADAALLTLDIQEILLQHGYSLKDATPFNVQFIGSNPIFIDICSVKQCSQTGVWEAYNQFCQSWLYPLLLYQRGLSDFRLLYLSYLDGIKLGNVMMLVGLWSFLRFGLVIDYLLPAVVSRSKKLQRQLKRLVPLRERPNSDKVQLMTVKRCKRVIGKLRKYKAYGNWTNYSETCSYTKENTEQKVEFIERFLKTHTIKTLLDVGCNIGNYSKLAAGYGVQVVAIDSDISCIECLYNSARSEGLPILPLCVDISNPSPAIGWGNKERKSFLERMEGRFDCVVVLALIHHLLVVDRAPLRFVAQLENRLTSKFLIAEFVGTGDRGFRELLEYRSQMYDYYNLEYFKKIHCEFFDIVAERVLIDEESQMERALFLMRKKGC